MFCDNFKVQHNETILSLQNCKLVKDTDENCKHVRDIDELVEELMGGYTVCKQNDIDWRLRE